jgi:hypothetical protein
MKLITIFADSETKEGLYAIQYENEANDEFERLLDFWSIHQNLETYLKNNEEYVISDFYKKATIPELADKLHNEALELKDLFVEAREMFYAGELKLQEIFWPLYDTQILFPVHQKAKTSIKDWRFRKSLLRLYAIRVSENAYVITGGAIKLVRKMEDHPDTRSELRKIEKVKAFLESIELYNADDLKLFEL